MGTAEKSRQRLKTLARGLTNDEIDSTYGPRAQPIIKAARDVGDAEVKKAPPTGDTRGPSYVKRAISVADPLRSTIDTTARAINEKRSRHEEIQRAIDNE